MDMRPSGQRLRSGGVRVRVVGVIGDDGRGRGADRVNVSGGPVQPVQNVARALAGIRVQLVVNVGELFSVLQELLALGVELPVNLEEALKHAGPAGVARPCWLTEDVVDAAYDDADVSGDLSEGDPEDGYPGDEGCCYSEPSEDLWHDGVVSFSDWGMEKAGPALGPAFIYGCCYAMRRIFKKEDSGEMVNPAIPRSFQLAPIMNFSPPW